VRAEIAAFDALRLAYLRNAPESEIDELRSVAYPLAAQSGR
jgi:hypothetical protein